MGTISRNIKLDEEKDKDLIEAIERMPISVLFRNAVRYYIAREPYAVFPERVPPRHVEEAMREQARQTESQPTTGKTKANLDSL
jgi:hypothetical protein